MNSKDYEVMRKQVEDVFISLYVIDVGSLTSAHRVSHQEALSVAYLAVIRMENKAFSTLTEQAKKKLENLAIETKKLQDDLTGLKKATEKLSLISSALNILTSLAKLLK